MLSRSQEAFQRVSQQISSLRSSRLRAFASGSAAEVRDERGTFAWSSAAASAVSLQESSGCAKNMELREAKAELQRGLEADPQLRHLTADVWSNFFVRNVRTA